MNALWAALPINPSNAIGSLSERATLTEWCKDKLIEHKEYIHEYGDDLKEIKDWTWEKAMKNLEQDRLI